MTQQRSAHSYPCWGCHPAWELEGLTAHLVLWFPRWAPWGTPCMISTPTAYQGPGL